jgi:hypothetical protein
MIQFEDQFLHSSNDKVFEALDGFNTDNLGLSFVYPFRTLVLNKFLNLSLNSHRTIMGLLLALNNAII